MSGTTAELGLATATDSDDIEIYSVVNLAAALVALDALFSSTSGHNHSGAHQGGSIPVTALAQPLSLSSPSLTTPSLTSPTMTSPTVSSGGMTITAGGLTITAGGFTVTGASSVAGTLTATNVVASAGLTVSAGGAAVTGASSVVGTLTATNVVSTGALTVNTGGLTVSAGNVTLASNATLGGSLQAAQAAIGGVPIANVSLALYSQGLLLHGSPAATAGFLGISDFAGNGNAGPAAVLVNAKGTGSGPTDPQAFNGWVRGSLGTQVIWFPYAID